MVNIDKNVINYNLARLGKSHESVVLNKQIKHEVYAFHFSSIHYPEIIQEFDDFIINNQSFIVALKKKYGISESQ
ncbi:hypothetical protein SAMN05216262_11741 [Colwellia chukchiensis]|uniref:Uncharacterized protein n=1 Tax=Colwellia chukchiensis TaxID=641665 RepID=A0A1H7S5H7_9GAMM|nr:hypothetical protein [Colwellia chukchiensis]SEL67901.1 hypothetical protein SAMN05216262_11741 [Colwellia chukchiensis]